MTIQSIEDELNQLKSQGLSAVGAPAELHHEISLAPSPNPEMGDVGFPCFALAKVLKKGPPMIAQDIVSALEDSIGGTVVSEVLVAGPYVNFRYDRAEIAKRVLSAAVEAGGDLGRDQISDATNWMVEFSAPNTNKPQHLGHVRNNLLGASVSEILKFVGHDVTRVNLINDRGIHICKSMLAYQLFGDGETPESSGMKGDHLVGKYYVRFDQAFSEEYGAWKSSDEAAAKRDAWLAENPKKVEDLSDDDAAAAFFAAHKDDYFNETSDLGRRAKEMLRAWEEGDEEVVALWTLMNGWVFTGFDETYARLGIEFEKVYKESETYLLGKDLVSKGVSDGKFEQLDDGAVVCDLEKLGLHGQKVLLRSDGTSVYMTQDLGTALSRFDEFPIERMVYVVGDEQEYHFNVLFAILGLLRPELNDALFHLSYGMVLLPEGKMKSREGKVVDADDLLDEMTALAIDSVRERYPDLSDADVEKRATAIGPAALKFYILDFNPKTWVNFDPQKSISFEGRTGPYCLYSYARIQSIGRRLGGWPTVATVDRDAAFSALTSDLEFAVIQELREWPRMVALAARLLDPSKVTEQLFKICKAFSTMYNDPGHRIVELDGARKDGLILLSQAVGEVLRGGLKILGIETLDEM